MERTIIDWMFAHPWMTFFILMTLACSISSWGRGKKVTYNIDNPAERAFHVIKGRKRDDV